MSNINNIHAYYKLLDIYKKVYLQRGYWSRAARKNKFNMYYERFGYHHFKSDLEKIK